MMRAGPILSLYMQPMHSGCGQLPCSPYGACEQRHAGDHQKLPILAGRKGETENAAEIFDGHHLGGKHIWNADRIDEVHTGHPSQGTIESAPCASFDGESMLYGYEKWAVNNHGVRILNGSGGLT